MGLPSIREARKDGDLWVAGEDFHLNEKWVPAEFAPAYAYKRAGRVYFAGAVLRETGSNANPWDTLPDELLPYASETAGDGFEFVACNTEAPPSYEDKLSPFSVQHTTGQAHALAAEVTEGWLAVWLTPLHYLAARS